MFLAVFIVASPSQPFVCLLRKWPAAWTMWWARRARGCDWRRSL